jgi:hypothetical protein
VKAYVIEMSYTRQTSTDDTPPEGPPIRVAWNGEGVLSCPAPSSRKRQANDSQDNKDSKEDNKDSSCDMMSYTIQPNRVDFAILDAFSTRLKQETETDTLFIIQSSNNVYYWYQDLTPEQVEIYKSDPAVSCKLKA